VRDGAQPLQVRLLEHAQVFHHSKARHRQATLELAKREPVLLEQAIEQAAPRGICQRLGLRPRILSAETAYAGKLSPDSSSISRAEVRASCAAERPDAAMARSAR
jgi:hypothetical protein